MDNFKVSYSLKFSKNGFSLSHISFLFWNLFWWTFCRIWRLQTSDLEMVGKRREREIERDRKEKKKKPFCVKKMEFWRDVMPTAVWPDLAKFCHFGKTLQVKFLKVYFLFGKVLSLLWQIWYIIGLILIFANGQILKNNLTIWSRWTEGALWVNFTY